MVSPICIDLISFAPDTVYTCFRISAAGLVCMPASRVITINFRLLFIQIKPIELLAFVLIPLYFYFNK